MFADIVRVASFDGVSENGERSDFTTGETMTWAKRIDLTTAFLLVFRSGFTGPTLRVLFRQVHSRRSERGGWSGDSYENRAFIHSTNIIQERKTVTAQHCVAE